MKKKNQKQLLTSLLIENDIETIRQKLDYNDVDWIGTILENGFCGYKNQTITELKQEATERGLLEK